MGKNIEKSSLEILVRNMPEPIRELYESGHEVRATILRKKHLKRYGRNLTVRVWRGLLIDADMDEPAESIAGHIIGYFLHGEKAPILIYCGHDAVFTGDFGIRFSL